LRFGLVAVRLVVVRATVGVEVPADVDVGVDTTGQQRCVRQVDVDLLRVLVDRDDLAAVDDDGRVVEQPASAVDQTRRTDDDRIGESGRGDEEERGKQKSHGGDSTRARG
jgi:hypothetical protein